MMGVSVAKQLGYTLRMRLWPFRQTYYFPFTEERISSDQILSARPQLSLPMTNIKGSVQGEIDAIMKKGRP